MLDEFTLEVFRGLLGERFRIDTHEVGLLEVELVEATAAAGGGASQAGRPFSVVFRGPLEPILPQRIYRFEHESPGAFDLFIVPIGPDESGMQYEAVFG